MSTMDLSAKLHRFELNSSFPIGTVILDARKAAVRPYVRLASNSVVTQTLRGNANLIKTSHLFGPKRGSFDTAARLSAVAVETSMAEATTEEDIESLFSETNVDELDKKSANKQSNTGASSISSGVKLENVSKSYKGVTVLRDVSWEVKKGEKSGIGWCKWGRKDDTDEDYCWSGRARFGECNKSKTKYENCI